MGCPGLKNIGLTLWPIQKTSFWFCRHVPGNAGVDAGGGRALSGSMLNADTNRENNPIYIALGHKHSIIHSLYSFIHFKSTMQNIVDTTILRLQY